MPITSTPFRYLVEYTVDSRYTARTITMKTMVEFWMKKKPTWGRMKYIMPAMARSTAPPMMEACFMPVRYRMPAAPGISMISTASNWPRIILSAPPQARG